MPTLHQSCLADFSNFLMYTTPNGDVKIEALLHNETLWLNQDKMAQLFNVDRTVITKHLKNIYAEQELEESATSAKIAQVQHEGERQVQRNITFYNLDVIISVGYRVNSKQATLFRIRSTKILKEYIIKGFAMDDERLKNPNQPFGQDYFDEQLERIRAIRASERRFYQKITDLYAQCSIDYDPNALQTLQFFATVQNKLHFAITGKTAAELIYQRADAKKKHMGLTTRKYGPKWSIKKSDTMIAKNYLSKKEIEGMNRIVTMYLDYAEEQTKQKKAMTMNDRIKKLDAFLQFNEKDILQTTGTISAELAQTTAEQEREKFMKQKDSVPSDFDQFIQKLWAKDSHRNIP